ncbi:MAG: hypothetical protein RI995_1214 [Bacteroidota bacterium]
MKRIKNPVAKDLRTPKYEMRVVPLKKVYDRNKDKSNILKELRGGF